MNVSAAIFLAICVLQPFIAWHVLLKNCRLNYLIICLNLTCRLGSPPINYDVLNLLKKGEGVDIDFTSFGVGVLSFDFVVESYCLGFSVKTTDSLLSFCLGEAGASAAYILFWFTRFISKVYSCCSFFKDLTGGFPVASAKFAFLFAATSRACWTLSAKECYLRRAGEQSSFVDLSSLKEVFLIIFSIGSVLY